MSSLLRLLGQNKKVIVLDGATAVELDLVVKKGVNTGDLINAMNTGEVKTPELPHHTIKYSKRSGTETYVMCREPAVWDIQYYAGMQIGNHHVRLAMPWLIFKYVWSATADKPTGYMAFANQSPIQSGAVKISPPWLPNHETDGRICTGMGGNNLDAFRTQGTRAEKLTRHMGEVMAGQFNLDWLNRVSPTWPEMIRTGNWAALVDEYQGDHWNAPLHEMMQKWHAWTAEVGVNGPTLACGLVQSSIRKDVYIP